jgi:glutaredoxin-related protein
VINVKQFDKEYSTQYTPEMKYLESIGIKYNFVKVINEVNTYKYSKTPELFHALEIFYAQK